MLNNIMHIMFYTHDKMRLVKFYQEKLGFVKNNPNDEDIFMMHLPNGSPTLGFIEHKEMKVDHRALELTFHVESREKTVIELKKRGIKFSNESNDVAPGMYVANFQDPDGNHLAILSFNP